MPQGQFKKKSLPGTLKGKGKKQPKKGAPVTKRKSHPIQPKKTTIEEAKKLKQTITKTVRKNIEDDIRARASSKDGANLSKAQQAVAEYNKGASSAT